MSQYTDLELNSTSNFALTGRHLGSEHGCQDYSGMLTLKGALIVNEDWLRNMVDQRDALLANLTEAAATLRRYETLHRAKNTDESTAKAEVNAELATRFEATIAKASGRAIAVHDGAKDAATVQERCLGDDYVHAWKTGPADAGATNLLPIVEALLDKAYKQNWNDQYPELLEQAEAAVAAAKGGAQ